MKIKLILRIELKTSYLFLSNYMHSDFHFTEKTKKERERENEISLCFFPITCEYFAGLV